MAKNNNQTRLEVYKKLISTGSVQDIINRARIDDCNIDYEFGEGNTLLNLSVSLDNWAFAELLLKAGANTEVKKDGCTPIFFAVRADKIELVKTFVEHKAKVKAVDHNGNTLLHAVKSKGMAELLWSNGVCPALKNNIGDVPLKIVHTTDPTNNELIQFFRSVAVMPSVAAGDMAGVVDFLEQGGNPNAFIYSNMTFNLLQMACRANLQDIVKLLIQKGANANPELAFGVPPLTSAVVNDNFDMVSCILEKNPNVNACGDGLPALFYAKSLKIVEALVKAGADLSLTSRKETALESIISRIHKSDEDFKIIEYLKKLVSTNIIDNENKEKVQEVLDTSADFSTVQQDETGGNVAISGNDSEYV